MPQVDQITVVAAEEAFRLQFFFQFFQRAGGFQHPVRGVVQQIMALHLDVPDLRCLDVLGPVVCVHLQDGAVVFLGRFQRPGDLEFEREVVDRLQHKVQRVHLIPGDGVLRQIGHEHQHCIRCRLPHFAGGVHTVQVGHLHIHEYDLGVLVPLLQKLRPARIPGDLKPTVILCIVLVQALF